MGIGSIGNSYLNFVFGTGAEKAGQVIKRQIANRAINKQGYLKALGTGTIKGIKVANRSQARAGGFFKSLKQGFKAIPQGWEAGKGFGKLTGVLKGCGKAMPALFAGLMILGEIPNVYKAVKEKGVVQGFKEVGKTVARLGGGALGSAIGSAILPGIGSLVGWTVGEWLTSKIVGQSYSAKTAETEENKTTKENQNTPATNPQNEVGTYIANRTISTPAVIGGGHIELPPTDEGDFGPYRPYSNIFYNYPQAYMDMGARMPGQSGVVGMGVMNPGMWYGTSNNMSPNLLDKVSNGGNLLTPVGKQNAYHKIQNNTAGNKLNIEK